jgi:hypothetical protein
MHLTAPRIERAAGDAFPLARHAHFNGGLGKQIINLARRYRLMQTIRLFGGGL